MAVPKRKMSRSNTRSRRSQWKATPTTLTATVEGGQTVTQVVLTVTNVADTTEYLTIGATAVDLVHGNSEAVTVGGTGLPPPPLWNTTSTQ